jgi:hypothetical protein
MKSPSSLCSQRRTQCAVAELILSLLLFPHSTIRTLPGLLKYFQYPTVNPAVAREDFFIMDAEPAA